MTNQTIAAAHSNKEQRWMKKGNTRGMCLFCIQAATLADNKYPLSPYDQADGSTLLSLLEMESDHYWPTAYAIVSIG